MAFKLVSLAMAILLWWSVGRDQPIEIPLTVPVEFQNAPVNLEINSDYPFQARLTLRGPQGLLQRLSPSEVHAVLDLQGAVARRKHLRAFPQRHSCSAQRDRGADCAGAVSHQLRP